MSLSENLHNLGALMKTNLETKGVTGLTGNEGLTTLANKILDISSGSCDSLTLMGFPQIIQKDETSHIGAKLIVSGSPVVNETIYFNIKPPEKYYADYNSFSQLFTENSLGDSGYKSKGKIIQFTASGDTKISFISEAASNPYLTETLGKGEYIITFYDSPFQLFEVINGEAVYIKGISAPSGDVWFDFEKNSSNDNVTNIRIRERITITSAKTDENGIATIPYVGTGKGAMTVEANYYKNGGIFLQETYELKDGIFVDIGITGSKNNNWYTSNMSVSTDSIGITLSNTAYGAIYADDPSHTAYHDWNSPFIVECDIISFENANLMLNDGVTSAAQSFSTLGITANNHLKVVNTGSKVKWFIDGEEKTSLESDISSSPCQIAFRVGGAGGNIKYKNFVIYPI